MCKMGPLKLMDTGGWDRGSGEPKASAHHRCVGERDGCGGDGDVCLGVFLPRRLLSAEELLGETPVCVCTRVEVMCVY